MIPYLLDKTATRQHSWPLYGLLALWTLGIVPDVVRLRETARVELRRPAPDGNPCAVPWSGGHAATAPDAVILDGRGAVTGVNGWVSLLVLRPTPWWSEDAVFVDEAPRDDREADG